jgi:hypothetical protein
MSALQPEFEARPVCAFHADIVAVFTCTRCGSFACPRCRSAPDVDLCERCASLVAVPDWAEGVSLGALLGGSFRLFAGNLQAVGVFALVLGLLELANSAGRAAVGDEAWIGFNLVITLASVAGYTRWVGDGLQLGVEARSVGLALRAALFRFLFLGLVGVLYSVLVTVGLYMLILPGLYLALSMSLAPVAVVLDGFGPYAALRRSYDMMKGYRLRVLGLFSVMLVVGVVGGAVLALTIVFVTAFIAAMVGSSFADKTPAALDALLMSGVMAGLLCFLQSAGVVAYLRIRESERTAAKPMRR